MLTMQGQLWVTYFTRFIHEPRPYGASVANAPLFNFCWKICSLHFQPNMSYIRPAKLSLRSSRSHYRER